MNDEEPLVVFNEHALPLFVDANIRITCMAVFSWNNLNQFSYFPIIVQPPNFKNLYISLFICKEEDELKGSLEKILNDNEGFNLDVENMKYKTIDNFDPLHYDAKSPTFLYLGNVDEKKLTFNLARISQQVLNPLGVGVFYSTQFTFATPMIGPSKGSKYVQAPFSMEIVDRLLYKPSFEDKDINNTDALSLMCLQYPLRPLFAPIDDQKNVLRRRLIFSRIMLKNPPKFFIKDFFKKYENKVIEPFKWVIVNLQRQVQKPVFVVILKNEKKDSKNNHSLPLSDMKYQEMLNINPWNKKAFNVVVQIKNQKAAIISPYQGVLRVYSEEKDVPWDAMIYDHL